MSVHRYHPDPHRGDPIIDSVLFDDCERCAEHAAHPDLSLDSDHLRRLLDVANGSVVAATATEAAAAMQYAGQR